MLGLQVPLLTDADRMNDGFGTSGQPHDRLLTWPYQEKNTMFYDSSQQKAVALSDAERARQVQVAAHTPAWRRPFLFLPAIVLSQFKCRV